MIKLFHNIRQNLLNEGKTSKYLKYAIGEIILVVIGILIALSLNNWKEYTADRSNERNQLKNIQEDILKDTTDVTFNIAYHTQFLNSEKELLAYMQSPDNKPVDSISYELALGLPMILTLHESSFNNLRNTDLNIITNDSLKQQISNHYDNFAKVILTLENDLDEYKTYRSKLPYFLKYFRLSNKVVIRDNTQFNTGDYFGPDVEFNKLVLVDTVGLKNDEAFKIVLAQSISFTKIKVQLYFDFLERIQELKKAIDQELRKKV
ncbi:MAG: DUF6090 family protein [Maribacter sp.]|nr:DUF6090 family protein [Maribacter sp.]